MADLPDLFGWGSYYTTTKSLADMVVEVAEASLSATRIHKSEIDAVLICSVNFHYAGDDLYQNVLTRLGLTHAYPVGVTLNNCTMLLSALEMARGMTTLGYRNILVISANKIENEDYRFQKYALFCDGAVSALVSATRQTGYEILGTKLVASIQPSIGGDGFDDGDLYRRAHERLMYELDMTTSNLEKVFCNNVFTPVVKIKEGRIGVRQNQLYLDNITQYAHCFSSDPLINLADYERAGQLSEGTRLMLTSNSDGLRAQTVLRYQI